MCVGFQEMRKGLINSHDSPQLPYRSWRLEHPFPPPPRVTAFFSSGHLFSAYKQRLVLLYREPVIGNQANVDLPTQIKSVE